MKVVAFVTQKGGSGKSTLAMGCAVAATEAGRITYALDTDPQGTLMDWYSEREAEEPVVDRVTADQLEPALKGLEKAGYQYVIIDTAGVDDASTLAAMRQADLCIIPTRTSPADVRAFKNTLGAILRLKKDFAFVVTQTPPRGFRIRETIAGASMVGMVCPTAIVQRADHQDAIGSGYGVTELNPDGKAASEIRELWQWIEKRLVRKHGQT